MLCLVMTCENLGLDFWGPTDSQLLDQLRCLELGTKLHQGCAWFQCSGLPWFKARWDMLSRAGEKMITGAREWNCSYCIITSYDQIMIVRHCYVPRIQIVSTHLQTMFRTVNAMASGATPRVGADQAMSSCEQSGHWWHAMALFTSLCSSGSLRPSCLEDLGSLRNKWKTADFAHLGSILAPFFPLFFGNLT